MSSFSGVIVWGGLVGFITASVACTPSPDGPAPPPRKLELSHPARVSEADLKRDLFPQSITVSGPIDLRWDLTKPSTSSYSWVVDGGDRASGSVDHSERTMSITVAATTNRATVVLEQAKGHRITSTGHKKVVNLPQVSFDVTPEGELDGDAKLDPGMLTLFAMPARPLAVGDTATIPIELPVTLQGKREIVKTTITVKLARVASCGKSRCAELESALSAESANGAGRIKARIVGVTYVDLVTHRLVAGDQYSQTVMQFASLPAMDIATDYICRFRTATP